tara:strand:- start:338 stop:574 length:237 start_codon:yes stop_codon:yes gene_type:complete
MSDNTVDFSQPTNKLDETHIKEALCHNNKIWWNTRAGYIIKTVYDSNQRTYKEQSIPYNLTPEGIPIKFDSNIISDNQ